MNVKQISNFVMFDSVFKLCKDEDGNVDWRRCARLDNLSNAFIIKYFHNLKGFGIEINSCFSEDLMKIFMNDINWFRILRYRDLSSDFISKNFDFFQRRNLLKPLFKYQKLPLEFLIEKIEVIENDNSLLELLLRNGQVDESISKKVFELVKDHNMRIQS